MLTSFALHLAAMGLMLCDHMWATIIPGQEWMTWVGRLAFPLFAFFTAEGFRHTSDRGRYLRRMVIFALLSEIPFNLMYVDLPIFPFHQNVLWTFAIAIFCMTRLEKHRSRGWDARGVAASAAWVSLGYLAGILLMTDYGGEGVLMALLFWLLPGKSWVERLGQLAVMVWLNWFQMKGQVVPLELLGVALELPKQGMAVLALPLIWGYSGKQGPYNKVIRWVYYGFYPVHMLVLALLR